jgi:cation transport protein ChaC
VGSYLPRWVKVSNGKDTVEAIAFTINREHQAYTGKVPLSVITHQIATAEGSLGSCTDYLLQTIDGLASEGIHDRYLITLRDRVLEMKQTNVEGQHLELASYYSLGLEVGDG